MQFTPMENRVYCLHKSIQIFDHNFGIVGLHMVQYWLPMSARRHNHNHVRVHVIMLTVSFVIHEYCPFWIQAHIFILYATPRGVGPLLKAPKLEVNKPLTIDARFCLLRLHHITIHPNGIPLNLHHYSPMYWNYIIHTRTQWPPNILIFIKPNRPMGLTMPQ